MTVGFICDETRSDDDDDQLMIVGSKPFLPLFQQAMVLPHKEHSEQCLLCYRLYKAGRSSELVVSKQSSVFRMKIKFNLHQPEFEITGGGNILILIMFDICSHVG